MGGSIQGLRRNVGNGKENPSSMRGRPKQEDDGSPGGGRGWRIDRRSEDKRQ